jgi:hypothetical protein
MSTNLIIFGEKFNTIWTSQGVHHTMALPFTLKSILKQKKNFGNLNISPCKSLIFLKSSKKKQNPSRYIITS